MPNLPSIDRARLLTRTLVALLLFSFPGCDDGGTEPELDAREIGVVVTSTDVSLTIFDVDQPEDTRVVGLGPDGSPVTLAVRGRLAAVPLGVVPAVAIVDLEQAELERTVALPQGSGATGAAFVNDSIVLVANPNLGTVSPVNALRGTLGEPVQVGVFPQAIVTQGGFAYVLNANLVDFAPAGPSSISVVDGSTLQVTATIALSGTNAGAADVGPDGLLYVVQSGSFGAGDGALSVVDLVARAEVAFAEGFGNFPGAVVAGAGGLVYVGSFGVGVSVWDAATRSFVRGPDEAVAPGGVPSTSGLGVDAAGRLYALEPDCQDPATVYRLAADYSVTATIGVGICPFAIAFTEIAGG